ncbi:unnamed protein product [Caenorhabditis bovis]|uniref:GPI alpha-1,4-mannosyltransferase I, catalytic subunit n=1 Tax=Caenorhabditis bovis TaxID=2654633 RepID=A0A8S1EWJ5_9PELO|nr:unnamed protein product [Caenorhabditis bovis]
MDRVRNFVQPEQFTRDRILICSLALRITLVLYSHIHDYIFKVNFTDIDYLVFSDAAKHVYEGRSPFDRETYRYTPALAWFLLPVVNFPDFGKILFCVCDIVVAMLYFKIMEKETNMLTDKREKSLESIQTTNVVCFWLLNPLCAVISARGNAESIVSMFVLLNILLLQNGKWILAAVVHGALAIHFKIYPIIYLPSVFLYLSSVSLQTTFTDKVKAFFTNWKGYAYVLITLGSFAAIVIFFYNIYGEVFLDEFLLYHVKRRDIKHNFSPYFFILYLANNDEFKSKLIGYFAFIPQILITVANAFRHYDDLPFCWFVTTWAFVSSNKVCTSQYFVWYLVLLPLVAHNIKMSSSRAFSLIAAWFASQGLWLLFAYLFEFEGWDTFVEMFAASCLFLLVNTVCVSQITKSYMVFYLIGLGLGDIEDITVKGLNIVKKCKRVHLEAYTSILCYGLDKSNLEKFYGREVIEADRTVVEQQSDEILDGADTDDVALLVVGDPFGATTHADLVLRAKQKNIPVRVIHNASIMNSVGCCGLQLYNFGETVSIVMWNEGCQPESYYDKIALNKKRGMHTLCLLDIKTKEQSVENMMRGRKIYEPARYLTCSEAASQLLEICKRRQARGEECAYDENTMVVGLARVGWNDQKIVYASMKEMVSIDMGPPLHSMIIPGETHPLEIDMLETFRN